MKTTETMTIRTGFWALIVCVVAFGVSSNILVSGVSDLPANPQPPTMPMPPGFIPPGDLGIPIDEFIDMLCTSAPSCSVCDDDDDDSDDGGGGPYGQCRRCEHWDDYLQDCVSGSCCWLEDSLEEFDEQLQSMCYDAMFDLANLWLLVAEHFEAMHQVHQVMHWVLLFAIGGISSDELNEVLEDFAENADELLEEILNETDDLNTDLEFIDIQGGFVNAGEAQLQECLDQEEIEGDDDELFEL